jgi:hypothetical protein
MRSLAVYARFFEIGECVFSLREMFFSAGVLEFEVGHFSRFQVICLAMSFGFGQILLMQLKE